MSETRFTKDHEWVRLDGDVATVGITDHAQEALGEIVFIELPETGRDVSEGDPVAVAESTKAASDVYAPLTGTVTAVNDAIVDAPGNVNAGAETDAWFFKLRLPDRGGFDALMDEDAYKAFLETL